MSDRLNVTLIGSKFMGRAHSNAWGQVGRFFDVEPRPKMQTVVARNAGELAEFADKWGWANHTTDWRAASLVDLTHHIVTKHHEFMKKELPRIGGLLDKVLSAHGANHPELTTVGTVFSGLRHEIEGHLAKEEQALFPMIQAMEVSGSVPSRHCGSVNNPIRVMEHEHDNAGEALRRLRELTSDYTAPDDGCATYQSLMAGLADMERDLHEHIHKENNILHPRAAELEATLLQTAAQES